MDYDIIYRFFIVYYNLCLSFYVVCLFYYEWKKKYIVLVVRMVFVKVVIFKYYYVMYDIKMIKDKKK